MKRAIIKKVLSIFMVFAIIATLIPAGIMPAKAADLPSFGNATEIELSLGQTSRKSGVLEMGQIVDWYKITPQKTASYLINLYQNVNYILDNIDISVYDAEGKLVSNNHDGDWLAGTYVTTDYTQPFLTKNKDYFISVKNRDPSKAVANRAYVLEVQSRPVDDDYGDTRNFAKTVTLTAGKTTTVTGNIEWAPYAYVYDDYDYFKFVAPISGEYVFKMISDPTNTGGPHMRKDTGHSMLLTHSANTKQNFVAGETYYIYVNGNSLNQMTGSYSFSITAPSAATPTPTPTKAPTPTPTSAPPVVDTGWFNRVSLAGKHSAAIKTDDTLWTWGANTFGQLGDGTYTDRKTPVKIMDNVKSVFTGGNYSQEATLIIKNDGSLWGCGDITGFGKSNVPIKIMDSGVVSAGIRDTFMVSEEEGYTAYAVVKEDGSLWTWGANYSGQLGDGTIISYAVPKKVINSGVKEAAVGRNDITILKTDGSAWIAGFSTTVEGIYGGPTIERQSFRKIVDSGVVSIFSRENQTIMVKTNGDLYTWDHDLYNGWDNNNDPCKAPFTKRMSDVAQTSINSEQHALVVKKDGTLWAWGNNEYGQLGDGTSVMVDKDAPKKILDSGAAYVKGGHIHSAVVKTDGSLWMAGYNGNGRLGTGENSDSNTFVQVMDPGSILKYATPTPTPTKAPTPTPVTQYRVTYNANGGSGSPMTTQINLGIGTITLIQNTFTRTGYTFAGWATSATGSVVYTDKQSFTLDKNLTLYAVWTSGDRFILDRDGYRFNNSRTSFGYPSTYRIPLERFQEVLGPVDGRIAFDSHKAWGGSCFGFASTAGLFFTKNLDVSKYNASTVYGIQTPGTPNSETTKLIEQFQASQWNQNINAEMRKNLNNRNILSELVTAVQEFQDTGKKPVIALMQGNDYGHAVIAYKVTSNGGSNYTLSLYDNNYPNQNRTLTLNTSTRAWHYEGDFTSTAAGSGLYFLYSQMVGENVSNLLDSNRVLLTVSSSIVDIYNSKGVHINQIKDAIPVETFDNQQHEGVAYYLPIDTYRVVPKEVPVFTSSVQAQASAEPLKVGASDGETYISVSNKNSFEVEVALGKNPGVEIKSAATDATDFNMSVTTTNTSLKTDKITVYKTNDDTITASLTGSKPANGTAIGVIKAGINKDSFGATTTELTFNSEDEVEESKATPTPKPKATPTAKPKATPKPVPNFIDVSKSAWYRKDVNYVVENGLMNGTSKNLFSPDMNLTRGMIVTILYRQAGSPDVSKLANPFSDVSNGTYYTKAVKWAAANKIVQGSGGKFKPDDNITRQDFSVILYRYAKFASIKMPAKRNYSNFADQSSIASYAKGAVETFYKAKIVNGKTGNNFDPKGNTTRAEGAAILHRFLKK
jgi:Listeria/Bacterioides repeat